MKIKSIPIISNYMLNKFRTIKVDQDLKLVILSPKNASEIFALTEENRDYLGKWLPWVSSATSINDSSNFIIDSLNQRKMGKTFGYGIMYKRKLVGHISVMYVSEKDKTLDIGYWISSQFAGLGIMTKCVTSLTYYCFNKLDAQKINISAEITNFGSNKVAQKAGYKRLEKQEIKDGRTFNIWQISRDTL